MDFIGGAKAAAAAVLSAVLTLTAVAYLPAPADAALWCPRSDYPTPLSPEPETSEENLYVGYLDACTGLDGRTYLRNRHDTAVWVVTEPSGHRTDETLILELFGLSKVLLFRAVLDQKGYRNFVLEPGRSVVVPAAPEKVRLALDPRVQAVWNQIAIFDFVIEQLSVKPPDWAKKAYSKVDATGAALFSCLLEAYGLAEEIAKDSRPSGAMQQLLLNNARAACGKELDDADRADRFKTSIVKRQLTQQATLSARPVVLADDAMKVSAISVGARILRRH